MNFFFKQSTTTTTTAASVATTESELQRNDFCYRHGHKLHNFGGKAPYPLSYDRSVFELEALDNQLCKYVRNSVSFVDFENPPKRILDLGCGVGTWAIDAAKEWPESEVVGFDLVDIQIPLQVLEPSIACRIEWKHGNFLTTQLPFEDDQFDHVHVQSIARAVPENKWGMLFEEISRVLRMDGIIEVVEDDIIFPTLPRWFISAIRTRDLFGRNSSESKNDMEPATGLHDHSLLESLHAAVYSNRFINMKPSSILPSYMITYFRNVELGHTTSFPMPPVAPLRPLPDPPSPPTAPTSQGTTDHNTSTDILDPLRTSISHLPSPCYSTTTEAEFEFSLHGHGSMASTETLVDEHPTAQPPNDTAAIDLGALPLPRRFFIGEEEISADGYKPLPTTVLHRQQLSSLSERSLAMQLYRSYQSVLACQDAMWQELKHRIRNRKHELIAFGWEDDEELEELQSRKKFEKLIERYEYDMGSRVSLWCSLKDLGWQVPSRDTLTKAAHVTEERLHQRLAEGRKEATWDDLLQTSRSVRVLIGHNL